MPGIPRNQPIELSPVGVVPPGDLVLPCSFTVHPQQHATGVANKSDEKPGRTQTSKEHSPSHLLRHGSWQDTRVAVTPRTILLVVGVFALQLLFIPGDIGAFHHPKPQRIPIALVAPAGTLPIPRRKLSHSLNALPDRPLDANVVSTRAAAKKNIRDREVAGALLIATSGPDTRIGRERCWGRRRRHIGHIPAECRGTTATPGDGG